MSGIWGRCGFKDGHQNDMFYKDMGLCFQDMITILGLLDNLITLGGPM